MLKRKISTARNQDKMLCPCFGFLFEYHGKQSKTAVLYAVIIIKMVSAIEENKIDSSSDDLKIKFGCVPPEKWTVIRSDSSNGEVVCTSMDYNPNVVPKEIALYPILMNLQDYTVVGIDEKKETMTIDITLFFGWVDERIKAVFSKTLGLITLPPVTTRERTHIWNPFKVMEIFNLKERKFNLDPIILKVGLVPSKSANEFLKGLHKSTSSLNNNSAVWSQMQWTVTVSCFFDFSSFPFDEHECNLTMRLPFDADLTIYDAKKDALRYVKDGFVISAHGLDPLKIYDELFDLHLLNFGIEVKMKRKLSKYIYQYYLPSITIVIASSVSFIIPLSAIPGRVALMGTQFLTLTNIFINQMVRTYRISTL